MTWLSLFLLALHGVSFYRALFVFTRTRLPMRLGLAWMTAAAITLVLYDFEAVTR